MKQKDKISKFLEIIQLILLPYTEIFWLLTDIESEKYL